MDSSGKGAPVRELILPSVLSTGVLSLDPEKNNHKLIFFTSSYDHTEQTVKTPQKSQPCVIAKKNTFQNGRHPVRAEFGFAICLWVNEPNKSNNDSIVSLILACAAILNFTMTTAVFGPTLVYFGGYVHVMLTVYDIIIIL